MGQVVKRRNLPEERRLVSDKVLLQFNVQNLISEPKLMRAMNYFFDNINAVVALQRFDDGVHQAA